MVRIFNYFLAIYVYGILLNFFEDIKNLRRGSLLWSSAAEVEVAEPHFPFEELEKAKKNVSFMFL